MLTEQFLRLSYIRHIHLLYAAVAHSQHDLAGRHFRVLAKIRRRDRALLQRLHKFIVGAFFLHCHSAAHPKQEQHDQHQSDQINANTSCTSVQKIVSFPYSSTTPTYGRLR